MTPKKKKQTGIQQPKNSDNDNRGTGTPKNKKRSQVPHISDSDSEDSGPSAPKKKKRNRNDAQPEPQKKNRKNRSKVWFHFDVCFLRVDDIEGKYAKCKYCAK